MILSHSFYFVKCGYTVFSPFFCGFCHLSHRPGTTSGVARKIGTGDARGKDKRLFFRFPGARAGDGWSPAFFRARSSPVPSLQTRPAGDRILPRTPVARPLFVGATTRRPHVSPVKQRAKEGGAVAPPSKRVLFDVRILSDVRARLFTTRARAGRAAFHAPRVTPPRGR